MSVIHVIHSNVFYLSPIFSFLSLCPFLFLYFCLSFIPFSVSVSTTHTGWVIMNNSERGGEVRVLSCKYLSHSLCFSIYIWDFCMSLCLSMSLSLSLMYISYVMHTRYLQYKDNASIGATLHTGWVIMNYLAREEEG